MYLVTGAMEPGVRGVATRQRRESGRERWHGAHVCVI